MNGPYKTMPDTTDATNNSPIAPRPAKIMSRWPFFRAPPSGTLNTGNLVNERTVPNIEVI